MLLFPIHRTNPKYNTDYVDNPRHRYGRMRMCHMLADSDAELHAIGVAQRWWQSPDATAGSHYDICLTKRAAAMNARRRETGALGAPEAALVWLAATTGTERSCCAVIALIASPRSAPVLIGAFLVLFLGVSRQVRGSSKGISDSGAAEGQAHLPAQVFQPGSVLRVKRIQVVVEQVAEFAVDALERAKAHLIYAQSGFSAVDAQWIRCGWWLGFERHKAAPVKYTLATVYHATG